jgi:hypothetical protein
VSSGADARFRIRMEDGSEVPIASLEALARRIDRGEVLPDTELFDAGTNAWSPARESAVVRFILDEREHEGLEPLEAWEGAFDEAETGPAEGEGGSDAFDLGLTLAPGTFGHAEGVDEEDEDDGEDGHAPSGEAPSDFESFTLGDDFGALRPEVGEDEDDVSPSRSAPVEEDPDRLPDLVFPGDEGPRHTPSDRGPQGGTSLDEWSSEAPSSPPATPTIPGEPMSGPPVSPVSRGKAPGQRPQPRPPRRRPEAEPAVPKGGAGKWLLAGIGVVAMVGAGVFFLGDRAEPTPDEPSVSNEVGPEEPDLAGRALVGEDLAGVAPVPSVPEGLEAPVARALRAVNSRFDVAVDSLRSVHGLADRPPPEWLSGYYLAHASEFPGVRAFWDDYGSLVGELRARDPELYLETAVRAASDPDPERSRAVEAYLEDRYRVVRPYRRERYIQLTRVAQRAMELHDFLEANEAEIRFTPATGPEIPLDPIMEAEVERTEIRSELLQRMDALFQALDLSRGGGAPAMGGLGQDLFRRFGEG